MKIGIIGSMHFTEKLMEIRDKLTLMGHNAFLLAEISDPFIGKSDKEKERIKQLQKKELDTIQYSWNVLQGADAVLVMNLSKNGIQNYIGGNSFMEMAFAYLRKQKIFLYHEIPEIAIYKSEIESLKPIVIKGDLRKIA